MFQRHFHFEIHRLVTNLIVRCSQGIRLSIPIRPQAVLVQLAEETRRTGDVVELCWEEEGEEEWNSNELEMEQAQMFPVENCSNLEQNKAFDSE